MDSRKYITRQINQNEEPQNAFLHYFSFEMKKMDLRELIIRINSKNSTHQLQKMLIQFMGAAGHAVDGTFALLVDLEKMHRFQESRVFPESPCTPPPKKFGETHLFLMP